jgi:hypothetical protein
MTVLCLLDVEGDEPFDCRDRVERGQEQPGVLEASPPSFDHRVRIGHLGLGNSAVGLVDVQEKLCHGTGSLSPQSRRHQP